MCGIVGYIGQKPAKSILIEGLKRLEYRGYDSAGIAVINGKKIECQKVLGKIKGLEEKARSLPWLGGIGIAHTRWATHGEPSEINAHPHADCQGKIMVVHNGIIENYRALKEELIKKGHQFKSATDSEVLAHLLEDNYVGDLREAVLTSFSRVRGTYGFAVLHQDQPDKIIGGRSGSPLVIGLGHEENFIASDITAIVSYTKEVIYLNDGEFCEITPHDYQIFSFASGNIAPQVSLVDWNIEEAEKGGFDHFMLKEIFEEAEAVKNAARGRLLPEEGMGKLGGLNLSEEEIRNINRLIFVACGTALYASRVGEYFIEKLARIPVETEYASEFRYRSPVLDQNTIVAAVSQSGETADTLAAVREAKQRGIKCLGIINVVGSTIARECGAGTYIHSGPEIGVASTKVFLGQLSAMLVMGLQFGRIRGALSQEGGKRIVEEFQEIPARIEGIMEKHENIRELAEKYQHYRDFFFLGRGVNYPVALEGALKLKEISYIHAEGYPIAELKHGPLALIEENFPSVVIVPRDEYYEKNISNIQEIRARRGKIIAIASEGDELIKEYADDVIYIPKTNSLLLPFLTVVPLHIFAYYFAVGLKRDVDKPRNLAKSVTVE